MRILLLIFKLIIDFFILEVNGINFRGLILCYWYNK